MKTGYNVVLHQTITPLLEAYHTFAVKRDAAGEFGVRWNTHCRGWWRLKKEADVAWQKYVTLFNQLYSASEEG